MLDEYLVRADSGSRIALLDAYVTSGDQPLGVSYSSDPRLRVGLVTTGRVPSGR